MILGKVFRKRGLMFLTLRISKNLVRIQTFSRSILIKKVFKLNLICNFNVLHFCMLKELKKIYS